MSKKDQVTTVNVPLSQKDSCRRKIKGGAGGENPSGLVGRKSRGSRQIIRQPKPHHEMSFEIKKATRRGVIPLIGLCSESGCGKTYSALLLARGYVGPVGKIVVIDTEPSRQSLRRRAAQGFEVLDLESAAYARALYRGHPNGREFRSADNRHGLHEPRVGGNVRGVRYGGGK